MASKEDEGECVTLTWEIQNFSLLLSVENGRLCTPFWKTEHAGKSVWRRLCIILTRDSNIRFGILSPKSCLQIDRCEVSLISSYREAPLKRYCEIFNNWFYAIERGAVLNGKRQLILSDGTMTLRCKIFEKSVTTQKIRINSVLNRISYLWNIENYNPYEFYTEYIVEENFVLKVFLTSKSENGTHTFIFDEASTIERCVSPTNSKITDATDSVSVIREIRRGQYNNRIFEIEIDLNNTRLDLQLESVFAVHEACQDHSKLPSPPRYENVSEAVSSAPPLGDDLLLLYRDKLFSDATLNTEGKSFHVHRNILAARSPVFRAMFEKDEMSEGRLGIVDIDDMDSETVDRMLNFLYGDSLESVQQWEEASALYYAADKYDIQRLKHKCASGLREGLTVDNACEALVLADRHSDDQLMKYIVDFIRKTEEVISSEKWDSFEKSNPLLAAKILRKLYVKITKK